MPRHATHRADQATYRIVHELDRTDSISATFTRQRFRPHFHETFLIGVTERGAEVFEARGARHISPAGSLRFHNPGEVHTGEPPSTGEWGYRCLYPSARLLNEVARELGRPGDIWFPEMIVADGTLAREFLEAFRTLEQPTAALERSTRFRVVLAQILAHHAGGLPVPSVRSRREPRPIAAAVTFINDRATQDFSLDELAQAVAMSPYHLIRAFKARSGLTPFAYQAQLRVERARGLLERGATVGETAASCGFFDGGHLARVFRSIVGVSPAAYQRAFLGFRDN